MLQYLVTIMETSSKNSDFNQSTLLHVILWLRSDWEKISQETSVKCFQQTDFHEQEEEDDECEDNMDLAIVIQ